MARHEGQLLALILAGMGTHAAAAGLATTTRSTDGLTLGGTLHLGGQVGGIAACGDEDEERHAAQGWRVLAWLLREQPEREPSSSLAWTPTLDTSRLTREDASGATMRGGAA